MAFDIAGHAVDDVSNRHTRVSNVGIVVDDGSRVDHGHAKREEALIPMDVAKKTCYYQEV
jgi:hypothetical protein